MLDRNVVRSQSRLKTKRALLLSLVEKLHNRTIAVGYHLPDGSLLKQVIPP